MLTPCFRCLNSLIDLHLGVETVDSGIQIGLPQLPEATSPALFSVIRHCLDDCTRNHRCWSATSGRLPKKVIDVSENDHTTVHLYETNNEKERYVALSHRWGAPEDHAFFCTYPNNVKKFKEEGIHVENLPQTFKDAVTTTKALGIQYLWIDSLCIIQGPDGDWKDQAKAMEEVFSSAYCVIAASRSTGTTDGFLKNRSQRKCATFLRNGEPAIYVCDMIDNFDAHALKAGLNGRGWVLQERALARRTIYFTKGQTYWECGHAVRCETLTKMKKYFPRTDTILISFANVFISAKSAFFADPDFPNVALEASKGGKIRLYEMLYKQYSRLALTKPEDRPVAISGLEKRMIEALNINGCYGIFDAKSESYLGRSLLWRRSVDERTMVRITFDPATVTPVPSWSWMAHRGAIDYMELPFDGVDWERMEITSTWRTGDDGVNVVLTGLTRNVLIKEEDDVVIDACGSDRDRELKCIVVGRSKEGLSDDEKMHYVLLVARVENGNWERVGVAQLPGRRIIWSESAVSVTLN